MVENELWVFSSFLYLQYMFTCTMYMCLMLLLASDVVTRDQKLNGSANLYPTAMNKKMPHCWIELNFSSCFHEVCFLWVKLLTTWVFNHVCSYDRAHWWSQLLNPHFQIFRRFGCKKLCKLPFPFHAEYEMQTNVILHLEDFGPDYIYPQSIIGESSDYL